MPQLQVDFTKFKAVFDNLNGRIKYDVGNLDTTKVKVLSTPPSQVKDTLDCSGFSRYIMFQASGVVIPDGSYYQRDWCEKNLQQIPYRSAQNELQIAFITSGVNGAGSGYGHVWFVRNGVTYECYGGHGVGSRPWDTNVLKTRVHKSFRLPLATQKTPARLILAVKDGDNVNYTHLQSAILKDGKFQVDTAELAKVLLGKECDIRSAIDKLGMSIYQEGDHLGDASDPRQYLFVQAKAGNG